MSRSLRHSRVVAPSPPHAAATSRTAVPWVAVVPVKRLERAKTRLEPLLAAAARADLALALALDTVDALLRTPAVARVVVVTDDARAAAGAAGLGAAVTPDTPDAGLNPALVHGAQVARAADPGCGVLALSADLGALRPRDLAGLLHDAPGQRRGWVRDLVGDGTTVLLAPPGQALEPSFGPGSAAAHAGSGAVELAAAPSLRVDVDTAADLGHAAALGLGRRARTVLSRG